MVYFLSDAHIGSRAMDYKAHEKQVCECLNTLAEDAAAIWLLGDMFDFWYEYFRGKAEEYELTISTLRSLTDKGIEVHFFTGNHDIWTFGGLAKRTGVTVHTHPEEVVVNGKLCYLAHGDGLAPSYMMSIYPKSVRRKIRRFMFLRWIFHNPVLQFLFRLLPPSWGDCFGYEWARRSRIKELDNPCGYKGEKNEELVLFAKEQEQNKHHDYYIFGHRHIELDLELANRARVIILGDMFKLFSYAAMDDTGNIQLKAFEI